MQVITPPQTLEMTSPQVALLLALEPVLEATGLRVVCARCAAHGFEHAQRADHVRRDATQRVVELQGSPYQQGNWGRCHGELHGYATDRPERGDTNLA